MADEAKALEVVASYVVNNDGRIQGDGFQKMQDALANGARVIDIITTPTNVTSGGNSSSPTRGEVIVTVLLAFQFPGKLMYKGGSV